VRTRIQSGGAWTGLQEFMIRLRASAPIEDIEFAGTDDAVPSGAALAAIGDARAIIIGPSNPVISIGPILAVPGMREALNEAAAPLVAVSPIVAGEVLKGPTAACLAWAGLTADAEGVVAFYEGLIDAIVSDEAVEAVPSLRCETLMASADQRRALAGRVLELAESVTRR
jgi:LPPG:FO 2-phospho-L-lactate transferase